METHLESMSFPGVGGSSLKMPRLGLPSSSSLNVVTNQNVRTTVETPIMLHRLASSSPSAGLRGIQHHRARRSCLHEPAPRLRSHLLILPLKTHSHPPAPLVALALVTLNTRVPAPPRECAPHSPEARSLHPPSSEWAAAPRFLSGQQCAAGSDTRPPCP